MSHDSEAAVDALGDLRDARLLGNSGLRVSPLCFGCMNLGDSSMADQETSRKLMEQYIEQGGNFFDTANVYEKGMSEKWLGEFLQSQRSRAVIATKFGGCTDGSDPNAGGNHRKNLVQSLDASLKRLGTDYVDLLYVHIWEYRTPVEEVMRSLDDVVRSGKALYVAISDTVAWKIAQANTTATLRGWSPFVGVQTQYSLTERTAERDLLPCATTRLQPPPWASLSCLPGPAAAESTCLLGRPSTPTLAVPTAPTLHRRAHRRRRAPIVCNASAEGHAPWAGSVAQVLPRAGAGGGAVGLALAGPADGQVQPPERRAGRGPRVARVGCPMPPGSCGGSPGAWQQPRSGHASGHAPKGHALSPARPRLAGSVARRSGGRPGSARLLPRRLRRS
jgi:predicted oxidoreductase